MEIDSQKGFFHCIGIGGAGVSALAEILLEKGCKVSGSDLVLNEKCEKLRAMGAVIAPVGHRRENLPETCACVIYTSAAAADNVELSAAQERNIPAYRRGEFLALLAQNYARPVAVAGAHGKSSVSAMTGWILRNSCVPAGMMVGAEVVNAPNAAAGNGDIFVTEADESDGSFALLSGELALIPNIDDDHAWSAAARKKLDKLFLEFAQKFRQVIYLAGDHAERVLAKVPHAHCIGNEELAILEEFIPARFLGFERLDAALALAGAVHFGIKLEDGAKALERFPGVLRRMTERAANADGSIRVVEDYAHHPAELAASLEVLRLRYPGRKLLVIFQPHRFQRLERYFDRFVEILSQGGAQIWLPPVFAAWSETGKVDSAALAQAINAAGGCATSVKADYPLLASVVWGVAQMDAPSVIAVIGAGDLCAVLPEFVKKTEKFA